ncbi:aspartyl-phosphate phosphatase Spo0E family protein [Paenibacillus sp. RC67]|uniref:aspartyl-phosphate phosphatase Spo0E family protein n=1 Tax=Paenibacillus sp. RC67 TaxID=3039392 RepID=UPI0024AD651C|nr:aspartyl-phosphate phosphatase Spo0E family protein [Paenibacillus sp. RC67]
MVSLFEFFFDEIGRLRKKMHEAKVNSLCDPRILKISERLDEKLNNFQRLLQISSPECIDQILHSQEQLILQHQNKNMSFEYNAIKTFVYFSKTFLGYMQKRPDISTDPIDNDVRLFLSSINESDECILNQFVLTYEGRILSKEEAKKFISFVRTEKSSV